MDTAVLDPLAPTPRGVWIGGGVLVRRRRGPHRPHRIPGAVCTERFCAQRAGDSLIVEHDLSPGELCDGLTVMLAEQLVDTGALRGQAEFEKVFTGVVRSTVDGGLAAWLRFYRNTLRRLERDATSPALTFAPIHAWAATQVLGHRVVDLGSCFGFFPLRLARRGIDVLASDLSQPTMHLLESVSARLHRPLATLSCDAADVPLPDRSTDTVTARHLIEHLPVDTADTVLDEAVRLARRRVVVAVPFEDVARDSYGHVQRFDLPALQQMAGELTRRHRGLSARAYEFHGGWLILDR
ncbi:MAG: mycofactocin oligosaccharide methyltransferase MftM [Mycobacterium sp.]|nr:mycofactocin oligosaccharide methyltransferase MftM [Mycobacterium sp.]